MLLNSNRQNLDTNEPWVKAVSAHLPTGKVSKAPPPLASFFVCQKQKLLYAPIAKCGCTSLKHLMVELSELEHGALILEHGVHRVTDAFITGAQLKDYSGPVIDAIINGSDYYKFAVVREPVRRLISAYTEKFLVNRLNPANLIHTMAPIQHIRCQNRPDTAKGITFREFVDYIIQSEPTRLDSHWAPQYLYLRGVPNFDAIFTMEQMSDLAATLSSLTGRPIQLGKHNTSVTDQAGQKASTGGHCDMLPCDLDAIDDVCPEDFMASDIVANIQNYYREDLALYTSAQEGLRGYTPPPVRAASFDIEALEVPLISAPEIARFVNIYTKGFFSFDLDGTAQVQVIINNTGPYHLNLGALPACSLLYEMRDDNAHLIQGATAQLVQLGVLEPNGIETVSLTLRLPPSKLASANTATISLRFGDEFLVEDVSPLHLAVAVRAGSPAS